MRMSLVEGASGEIDALASDEGELFHRASTLEPELRATLVELIVLMAIYDGAVTAEERLFLAKASQQLGIPLDLLTIERRAAEYHAIIEKNFFEEKATAAGDAVVGALGAAGRFAKTTMKRIGNAAKTGPRGSTFGSASSTE